MKIRIHGNDWHAHDISENVNWCKAHNWKFIRYAKEDDHDHCLICYWTIHKSDDPEVGEAYFYGGSTWLCSECYGQFIKEA
ncbi:hypothetical protein GCM10007047_29930 [Cerasicoccus arenae]|uniref:Uncharacterized protein n=1 Tax=Cerasicoccus arenae TaxID=424488 RepID=A0A8J3GEN7_9BACT|nr:hypothetical protein GCM10007047_29930 [Cerasicoccus arenae]